MLVVNRFRVAVTEAEAWAASLRDVLDILSRCPGFADGEVGRNVDDPGLWLLSTRWRDVGSYRRALSSYDVRLHAFRVLARALDEPSAYETVAPGAGPLNEARPRELP